MGTTTHCAELDRCVTDLSGYYALILFVEISIYMYRLPQVWFLIMLIGILISLDNVRPINVASSAAQYSNLEKNVDVFGATLAFPKPNIGCLATRLI